MIVVTIGLIKARIPNAKLIVKDLMSGSLKPDKIIFCVSKEPHLRDKGIQPNELPKINNPKVEFKYVENFGPLRRIVNIVQEYYEKPETKIIIFDDDRKPGNDTIQKLVEYSNKHQNQALSIAGNIHNYTDKKLLENQGVIFQGLIWEKHEIKELGIVLGWVIRNPIEVDTLSPGVGMLVKPRFFGKDFLNWKTVYKDMEMGIEYTDQAFISYSLKKNNIKKIVILAGYVPEYPEYPNEYFTHDYWKLHPKMKARSYYRLKQLKKWIID